MIPRLGLAAGAIETADQGLDDITVELGPGVAAQLVDRVTVARRQSIRTVGGHRLKRIGDLDDARLERNLAAGEAVWVTGSVDALMVVSHPAGLDGHVGGLDDRRSEH